MSRLNPEDLQVSSFQTEADAIIGPGGGYCCTGCVSGCGINPTASGCESGGGKDIFTIQREAVY